MGIDISAKLMVGLEYSDLKDWIQNKIESGDYEDEQEVIEEYFEYASPYYDAPMQSWFLGIEAWDYGTVEEVMKSINEAITSFREITGLDPIINATQHVY
jgi:hypothetical protein